VKPSIELYTDGACRKTGEGGWGYVLRVTVSGKELEGSGGVMGTTSQRMELTAALEGLQRLECPCKVKLVSDSQYLVKGLTTWVTMWECDGWTKAGGDPVLNKDLWVALLAQSRRHEVVAEWVRGHSGHPENERCDKLATAASQALITPQAVT
jgi:ribonuclease HI